MVVQSGCLDWDRIQHEDSCLDRDHEMEEYDIQYIVIDENHVHDPEEAYRIQDQDIQYIVMDENHVHDPEEAYRIQDQDIQYIVMDENHIHDHSVDPEEAYHSQDQDIQDYSVDPEEAWADLGDPGWCRLQSLARCHGVNLSEWRNY